MPDFESSATKGSLTVGGHKVYSLYMNAREGYRLTAEGKGMPAALGTPRGSTARRRHAHQQRVLLGLRQRLDRSHRLRP